MKKSNETDSLTFTNKHSIREKLLMDDLKAKGKEKSATYRQYMGNRLMYTKFLAIYKAYGLRD